MLTATEKRERFRAVLARESLMVMPGGFSPLFAMMADELGFEGFFLAGSQMSAFLFGVPDLWAVSSGQRNKLTQCLHWLKES